MIRLTAGTFIAASILWIGCTQAPSSEPGVYERTEYVMGTMLRIRVEAKSLEQARRAVDTAFEVVHRLDRLLSNYDSTSEISALAEKAPSPVQVSVPTFDFVAQTLTWCGLSDGALNPAIGPVVELWGFYSDSPHRPDSQSLARRLVDCDYRNIRLDSISRSIALDRGMQFDPGASGKGYALRQAARATRGPHIRALEFDFGGQIYRHGPDTVLVPVRHPRSDTTAVAWLAFASGSVATSGDYERYFELDDIRFSHILDPASGLPVQDRAAVTVFATDPFVADALSTALFVRGPDRCEQLLNSYAAGALFAEWHGDSLVFVERGRWPEAP